MKKDTKGKPKLGLIPYDALAEIAKVREFGIEKYKDDEGWRGVSITDFLDAALRHIYKYNDIDRSELDEESGLSHLAHAATSLILALAVEKGIDRKLGEECEHLIKEVEAGRMKIVPLDPEDLFGDDDG